LGLRQQGIDAVGQRIHHACLSLVGHFSGRRLGRRLSMAASASFNSRPQGGFCYYFSSHLPSAENNFSLVVLVNKALHLGIHHFAPAPAAEDAVVARTL